MVIVDMSYTLEAAVDISDISYTLGAAVDIGNVYYALGAAWILWTYLIL